MSHLEPIQVVSDRGRGKLDSPFFAQSSDLGPAARQPCKLARLARTYLLAASAGLTRDATFGSSWSGR